jgi:uncharacterized membrane protein YbhN (UPF0104 family)
MIAIIYLARSVDVAALRRAAGQAASQPVRVGLALAAFGLAFAVRSVAWRRLLPTLGFGHALGAIHLALGANHVLPFRLGEPFRVLSVTRRANISLDAAAASTVTLRFADVLAVATIGLVVAPAAFLGLIGPIGWILLACVAAGAVYVWQWLAAIARRRNDVRFPDPLTFALSVVAWLFESVLVREAAGWAGLEISWSDAAFVTAVAVAAQVAAVAPGGFGTYEAAAVAAYATLGYDPEAALVAALGAHALKTAYSLTVGAVALFFPTPGFLGRFRLSQTLPEKPTSPSTHAGDIMSASSETASNTDSAAPILLFMPAYNEERSVGACIARAPSHMLGHPVQTLVIDDGSSDHTGAVAAAAGADVLSLGQNRGLGAAVRVGLAEGVTRSAAAVAFCDADGEYPPEELATLVGPIIAGEADYVTGSRFLGRIDHMRPHRRLGNIVLTRLLSLAARRKITDGQTGYRAFSPTAAADAEVIHDFNYAQVLTLDLLAKGYRHREVPISYRFRTEGESFIKLGNYLRNVGPAVYRELNTK